ncbi:MAG: malonyl-ACP O-methyltransferase BioC [Gammaproteobacteria bacterium]|nr:malonyl-ACP O-methyltransferase BioC [Gammaproteobacteria bacterium]
MMSDSPYFIEKRLIRNAFNRAAASYDEAAVLQREVLARLLEKFEYIKTSPLRILDLGAGTGNALSPLKKLFPKAEIIAFDLSTAMLEVSQKKSGWLSRQLKQQPCVCGDMAALPFADQTFDLVFSNLCLQWAEDFDQVFLEISRVMNDAAVLLFSSFGPDTLKELRQCWAGVDNHTHVNVFADIHDLGDSMLKAHLADPVMEAEMLTMTYKDVNVLMRDIKQIGANNMTAGRHRGLGGKKRLQAMRENYEQLRNQEGLLPATWEVVYGHAWGVGGKQAGQIEIDMTAFD